MAMQDPIIGVDTEWRPDSFPGEHDTAMIQLATPTVAVLVRTCMMGGIPDELIEWCR